MRTIIGVCVLALVCFPGTHIFSSPMTHDERPLIEQTMSLREFLTDADYEKLSIHEYSEEFIKKVSEMDIAYFESTCEMVGFILGMGLTLLVTICAAYARVKAAEKHYYSDKGCCSC